MGRSAMLGIVGDCGSGKTTLARGLVRALGEGQVTAICTDDYHRYDRRQRAERDITPLDPECNHLDILAQDLEHLRRREAIMKPVYRHADGTFGPPLYVEPGPFVVAEGLLGFSNRQLAACFDIRVFVDSPEELRRHWKVEHDCSRRGYTTDQVLMEIDRCESDSERYIRPQRHRADIIVAFQPAPIEDQERLECKLTLRDTLARPDLSGVVSRDDGEGIVVAERPGAIELAIPGTIHPERAALIEQAIWDKMHIAADLHSERLGEFTIGSDLYRSDSLAVVQLLLLYQLVTAATEADAAR